MDRLQDLSTFDLAFNLATGVYNEQQKFEALKIIRSRDTKTPIVETVSVNNAVEEKITNQVITQNKKPLKGSKAEKIQKLIDTGKTAKEIYEKLNNSGTKVYYPEIYRLMKKK